MIYAAALSIVTIHLHRPLHASICLDRCRRDHFMIVDDSTGYHIGTSLKDAGKKCFDIKRTNPH